MSDIVNTALCSFGMSGKVFHAPFLHAHPGFHLKSCWERSTQKINTEYDYVKSVSTYEEILSDKDIQLVIVNTPSASHFELAKKALLAGKNVVVEKPFVSTLAEAEELVKIAKDQGCVASVFQNRRFDSDFLTVKEIINAGRLGEIKEAEIHYDRYKLELSEKQHKEIAGPGVGVIYDLGSHIIDQALVLFGRPIALWADVDAMRPGSQVPDYFEIVLFYENNLRVRLKATYVAKLPSPAYVVHGMKGSFLKSRADIQETMLQQSIKPGGMKWGEEPESEWGTISDENGLRKIPSLPGNYMAFFEKLHGCITQGKENPVSAVEGRNVIEIIEKAYLSFEKRFVIKLD